ncbi:MAG TPA: HupE/UreJ family protein [Bryobacteraceae bacterium]|nr:HupE/UreJ family protein [Bryobacteraceae bacterium]
MKTLRAAALLLFAPLLAAAHEVPDHVIMRVFLKPQHDRLQILVRIPTVALIDTLFPMLPDSLFLDLKQTNEAASMPARVWVADLLSIHEGDTLLPRPRVVKTMISRDSDISFNTYADALAHINGPPLPDNALVMWDRSMLDVLLEAPIRSDQSDFSLVPRFGRLGVLVTNYIEFLPARGGRRDFVYEGDPEKYRLDPTLPQTIGHFIAVGFRHIFDETDHVLLLLCMALMLRRPRELLGFAIAFTIAHSITLLASALLPGPGPVWLPRVSGTLMALFIIYLGLESVFPATPARFRPLVAIASGMVFGSGFWFFFEPLVQYGGEHPVAAALSFNLGIEAGQYGALALLVPALALFFRFTPLNRAWTMVFAGFAAHVAWHRMTERAFTLSQVPFEWPTGEVWAALVAAAAIGVMVTLRGRKEAPGQ